MLEDQVALRGQTEELLVGRWHRSQPNGHLSKSIRKIGQRHEWSDKSIPHRRERQVPVDALRRFPSLVVSASSTTAF
jgi:hypothetical protein